MREFVCASGGLPLMTVPSVYKVQWPIRRQSSQRNHHTPPIKVPIQYTSTSSFLLTTFAVLTLRKTDKTHTQERIVCHGMSLCKKSCDLLHPSYLISAFLIGTTCRIHKSIPDYRKTYCIVFRKHTKALYRNETEDQTASQRQVQRQKPVI